jgi:exportin-1
VSIPTFLLDKWKTWKPRHHTNSYHSVQIKQFVLGLFAYTDDLNKFKTHLRDFLISLKEFSDDNAELYAEEREQAVRDAQAAERTRALKVGGLLKPSEMDQEDEL